MIVLDDYFCPTALMSFANFTKSCVFNSLGNFASGVQSLSCDEPYLLKYYDIKLISIINSVNK